MAIDDKTPPKQPTPIINTKPTGVPVALLILREGCSVDGVGRNGSNSIRAASEVNRPLTTIEYLPDARHHRVTFQQSAKTPPVVRMIPECNATSWEPVPQ